MKSPIKQTASVLSCAGAIVLLSGCADFQTQDKDHPPAAKQTTAPGTVSAYFPSGKMEGSGLLLEKSGPAEVISGQPFQYSYKVSNLTDLTLENVKVCDRVSGNFSPGDSYPKPSSVADGVATWNLGALAPKASQTISINGSGTEEGSINTCGWAAYNPVACQEIRVSKANISLTKTEPADELLCDPIPVVLTVKNTGSSPLTGVLIADTLPPGLTSDGKSSLSFAVGKLAPAETRELKYKAMASNTGRFLNEAVVTSAEGVSAKASAATTVHQPVLTINCKAPEQQFMGRKFDVCLKITNTGDAPAAGTMASLLVPAGIVTSEATAGGQAKNGSVAWDLGSIAAGDSKDVCATFTSATAGTFEFSGSVKGACANKVDSSCETKVVGVSAILLEKADDPDPVAVGDTTTYTVKVTNQGSADDSNVQVVVKIAAELEPVSTSEGAISGHTVTLPMVPKLAAKSSVSYKIVARGVKAGDGHTKFTLSSDVLKSPISAEESTTVY